MVPRQNPQTGSPSTLVPIMGKKGMSSALTISRLCLILNPNYQKYTKTRDTNFLENTVSREDDVIRALREEDAYKGNQGDILMYMIILQRIFTAKQTTEYCSYVQDHYVEVFHTAAKTHHIRLPPVFFANGTLVNPDELPIRLDNALVEIMFHLKHYYYPPSGGPGTNKFKTNKSWGNNESGGNTFTATIDQVKILKANNVIPSPVRQPTMKAIQGMPQPKNNEQTIPRKRTSSLSPSEASLSRPKKGKNKGMSNWSSNLITH